jgi:hypothetical protein
MNDFEAANFRDRVNGCPRLNGRLMRAMDAFINVEIEMSPVGRLARWLDEEAPPTAGANASSAHDS